jgi:hypothetical protein
MTFDHGLPDTFPTTLSSLLPVILGKTFTRFSPSRQAEFILKKTGFRDLRFRKKEAEFPAFGNVRRGKAATSQTGSG